MSGENGDEIRQSTPQSRRLDYDRWVNHTPPWRYKAVLHLANWVGKFVGRPSESLLTELAQKDRPGAPTRVANPTLRASHHIQLGQAAFESGDYAEALHCFAEAVRLAPDASWAWHGRGDALQLSGDPVGALRAYERACELDPETGLHHGGRANALAALNQPAEAQDAWNTALALDPNLDWMARGSKKP